MSSDLFISYSRRDNERGQVVALKAQIESSFRAFAGRELRVLFDRHEIHGMDACVRYVVKASFIHED